MTDGSAGRGADIQCFGTVVTAHRSPFKGSITIRDGLIASISETKVPPQGALDFGDRYILPGFVDVHVHSSSLGDEGLVRATAAAAAGGVTTLVDMPYDVPQPIDRAELVCAKGARLASEAHIDVGLLGTVSPAGGSAQVQEVLAAGACGVMLSLWEQDSRRYPRIEYAELLKILSKAAEVGGLVSMHPETDAIIRPLLEAALRKADQENWRLHAESRPPVSETHAALTGMEFAFQVGAKVHLHQLSLARSFDLIDRYRQEGAQVTGETIVHHLLMQEDDVGTLGGRAKINPPLRSSINREALWKRLADGKLSIVASDHSPWCLADKTRAEILKNQSGMPGLESFPSVLLSEAMRRDVPLSRMTEVTAYTPARTFGLRGKGEIRVGADADLIVFDPAATWRIDRRRLRTSAGWDPYEERDIRGRVVMTILRGRVVWDGERVLSEPGWGRWAKAASQTHSSPAKSGAQLHK